MAFMISKAYSETGPYTTAIFVFISIALESSLMIERLKDKRDKLIMAFLDNMINTTKQDRKDKPC